MTSLIYTILNICQKHALKVIIIMFIITGFFFYFAVQISINPDLFALIPEGEEYAERMEKYAAEEISGDVLILLFRSDNLFTLERVQAFSKAVNQILKLEGVDSGIHPFNFFGFTSSSRSLEVRPFAPGGEEPKNEQELNNFRDRITSDPFAVNMVLANDKKGFLAIFPLQEAFEFDQLEQNVRAIGNELKVYGDVYVSSSTFFMRLTRDFMFEDFSRLLGLAALAIILVNYLGFRSKRVLFIPVAMVGMGTIWCLGFMVIVGYELSIVSTIIPPLVLTLGSSYSIHVLTQYFRGAYRQNNKNWIADAVFPINRTILLAALTTIIGFLSLLSTSIPQTREFGIAASFGVFACAVLSLTFLPAVLSIIKGPESHQVGKVKQGLIAQWMRCLAGPIIKARYVIIIILGIIIISFPFSLKNIKYLSDYTSFFPADHSIIQDLKTVQKYSGGYQQLHVTIEAPEGEEGYFLRPDVLKQISLFEEILQKDHHVVYLSSFPAFIRNAHSITAGESGIPDSRGLILLISRYINIIAQAGGGDFFGDMANEDYSRITISFRVFDTEKMEMMHEGTLRNFVSTFKTYMADYLPSEVEAELWGSSLRFLGLSAIFQQDQIKAATISILLIIGVSSLAFWSLFYGFLAVVPLMSAIILNFSLMAFFKIPMDMTTIMVSSVAIGVGVDNAIHFLIQLRKQLAKKDQSMEMSICNAMEIAGRPIFLTTVSVVAGFIVLTFANFTPIFYFGILVSFTLLTAWLGTFIFLPALVAVIFQE